jgi:anti-sigma regulatory factor (Ser/Thr protein kinase)
MELAGRLLVTVEDTGTWSSPRTRREDPAASQGRGLALVEAVSDAMGHARGVDGSTVWFEIALDHEDS